MEISDFSINETHVVKMTMELDSEEWTPCLLRASAELQKRDPVHGFRAGKAPLAAAAKHYGQTLFSQASQEALVFALTKACEEKALDPVSQPLFSNVDATLLRLRAACTFITYPQVRDLPYIGVTIEKPQKICTEAAIDRAIEHFRYQHLNVHPVDRAAQMDDIVEVSFTGTHEGQPFPYDHNDRSRFRMGSGQLFAGLDEALVGRCAGESFAITLTMPEDFHRDDIRGMVLDLNIWLLGVWARELEECTDDFVRRSVKDCTTVAEFREKLRKQIQESSDIQCERLFQQNISAAIAGLVTCPLPEPMVQVALDGIINSLTAVAAGRNMTVTQLLESEGRTLEQYRAQCRPIAEDKVRRSIALDYVIRTENLQVSEEEYRSYMADYSDPVQAEKQAGGREEIVMGILNDRARELIIQKASVVTVTLPEMDD